MSNRAKMKLKKTPWVPPPGRTCNPNKIAGKSHTQAISTNAPCDTTKHPDDGDFSDVTSISSVSSSGGMPGQFNIHLNSVKHELKLFSLHFTTLRDMSRFLNEKFRASGIQDRAIAASLAKVDDRIKEFIFEFDDMEYCITYVENALPESSKTDEFFKMIKLKDVLLSKILECYSNIAKIFQTVIQKQITEEMTKFQKEHDLLQKELQTTENKCRSQEAVIMDLERRLSIAQGKTNTMESYKSTLEETRAELMKHLADKDSHIKYLMSELSQLSANQPSTNYNEKLLEVIEEMKKTSQAEKTALKKALKVEKLNVSQKEVLIEKMKKDLKSKDNMLQELAAQRDKLKLELTICNNNIIEGKYQIEEMKSQISKLQNGNHEKESSLKKKIQDISNDLKEKNESVDDLESKNSNLKKTAKSLTDELESKTKELSAMKSCLSGANTYLHENNEDKSQGNVLEEIKHLILLLKDTKKCFNDIQKIPLSAGDSVNEGNRTESYNLILRAIEEIKLNLIEMKNVCDIFPKEYNEKSKLEKEVTELQNLYSASIKENESLKAEIEEMKKSRNILPSGNYYSSTGSDNQLSVMNLQMELNLKAEEVRRLKQREKDLEYQLDEVKEKLQRKEIESVKLFSLEEELKSKKIEISVLSKRKEEEFERLSQRVKVLEDSLDKKTSECDNLHRHVEILKHSFTNVFGNS